MRFRLRTGDAAQQRSWPLDTLRCVAFWNHYRCTRSQGWDEFADLGDEVAALRRQVERGRLPLLEVVQQRVQFAHLSFQEYLSGVRMYHGLVKPWYDSRRGFVPWFTETVVALAWLDRSGGGFVPGLGPIYDRVA